MTISEAARSTSSTAHARPADVGENCALDDVGPKTAHAPETHARPSPAAPGTSRRPCTPITPATRQPPPTDGGWPFEVTQPLFMHAIRPWICAWTTARWQVRYIQDGRPDPFRSGATAEGHAGAPTARRRTNPGKPWRESAPWTTQVSKIACIPRTLRAVGAFRDHRPSRMTIMRATRQPSPERRWAFRGRQPLLMHAIRPRICAWVTARGHVRHTHDGRRGTFRSGATAGEKGGTLRRSPVGSRPTLERNRALPALNWWLQHPPVEAGGGEVLWRLGCRWWRGSGSGWAGRGASRSGRSRRCCRAGGGSGH